MTQTKMCKEFGLWALFWIGVLTSAWGQGHGFRMGLAMDPNVSWMNSRDFEHATNGGRAHFGYQFMADIMFSDTYAFGTGVHVFRTGSQIEYWEPTTDSTLSRVTRNFNNQYVELPLTFKFRTKEIGYTTYFGRFGAGLGLNTRREAVESRQEGYMKEEDLWQSDEPVIEDVINGDFTTLFRASLIVGVGLERKISGPTSLMVGLTYNNSLFNTHKGLDVVKVDGTGVPRFSDAGEALTTALDGHDSYLALSVGIVF